MVNGNRQFECRTAKRRRRARIYATRGTYEVPLWIHLSQNGQGFGKEFEQLSAFGGAKVTEKLVHALAKVLLE